MSLNTVDSVDAFSADVAAGRWDIVLPQVARALEASSSYLSVVTLFPSQVAQLQLPRLKLEDLYEHVFLVRRPIACKPGRLLSTRCAGTVRAV